MESSPMVERRVHRRITPRRSTPSAAGGLVVQASLAVVLALLLVRAEKVVGRGLPAGVALVARADLERARAVAGVGACAADVRRSHAAIRGRDLFAGRDDEPAGRPTRHALDR